MNETKLTTSEEAAFSRALRSGKVCNVRPWMERGVSPNYEFGTALFQPLDKAAESGSVELCLYLLQCGADVDTPAKLNAKWARGANQAVGYALLKAIMKADSQPLAAMLLAHGCSLHALQLKASRC